ncbi:DUF1361 domain-containing protein [Sporolactobacillus sp. CPB3-1]|uniref:DUF1361 domain-containing protein n=1 Tax=Sporolactobacillus mangiferae TaxID=2940498 RepID=A0ABT0MAY4_9BACL|nr:DUF1361 domain-containing protein [Sporolactobacillus mangiferae]MCL1631753.1 DUF1361 domain-containing protein [Sporolactobacillus mangiferae]
MFYKKRRRLNPLTYGFLTYLLSSVILYIVTKRTIHIMILWNLILSCVPVVLAALMYHAAKSKDWARVWLLGFLWMIFFPNAPYMITDFIHLQHLSFYTATQHATYTGDLLTWFSLFQVGIGVFIGTSMGMFSLWMIHQRFLIHLNVVIRRTFFFVFFLLSGYGMYIGRFLRLNSWDLFNLSKVTNYLTDHFTAFTLTFTLVAAGYTFLAYWTLFLLLFIPLNIYGKR